MLRKITLRKNIFYAKIDDKEYRLVFNRVDKEYLYAC